MNKPMTEEEQDNIIKIAATRFLTNPEIEAPKLRADNRHTNPNIEALALKGTPLRLELRTGDNPFKGRRNKLTERQVNRRRRLMAHVKKGKKKQKR